MHERTILILLMLQAMVFAIVQGICWLRRQQESAWGFWSVANSARILCLLPMLAQPEPDASLLALGAVPLLLQWCGMRLFAGRALGRGLLSFVFVLTLGVLVVAPAAADTAAQRVMTLTLFFGAFHLLIAIDLATGRVRENWPVRYMAILSFLLFAAYYFNRAWHARTEALDTEWLVPESALLPVLIFMFVHQTVWNVSAIVMAMERLQTQLQRAAIYDPLTEVLNRAGFGEMGARYLQRARHSGERAAVMMMDLDHFKSINDRWGHDVGDAVLRRFSAVARATLRPTDLLSRYGGEEFCAILPKADETDAANAAERLRRDFEQAITEVARLEVRATVSIGIAEIPPMEDGLAQAITAADAALYSAKMQGRNRVCTASSLDAMTEASGPSLRLRTSLEPKAS